MKRFITLFISVVLVFLMAITSSAATIASVVAGVDTDMDRTVQVTVTYNSPEEAQESTLLVVKKGVSIVTAKSSDIRYIDQKEVKGSSVTYSFKMAKNDRVGEYDLYVGGTKVDAPESTVISFETNATVTIKFVNEDGEEIASRAMVATQMGDTIDLGAYVPDTITFGTSVYSKDATNPDTYEVTSSSDTISITYTYLMEKREKVTVNGISYDVVTENLIYNGDMSQTTTDGTYTAVAGWQGGYVNSSHKLLSERPYLSEGGGWRSTTDHHFIYTEATEDTLAYVTTPAVTTMTNSEQYPYKNDASENYMASVITSWMRDSRNMNSYLKAESGKQYYMSFEMKATSIPAAGVLNVVGFGAVTANGDSYSNSIPGTNGDIATLNHVADNSIERGRYVNSVNTWTKVEALADVRQNGYFVFQLGWAHEWGQVSLRNFKIFEVEPSATNKDVTITYTINGVAVKEKTETIDTSAVTMATFKEYYHRNNGDNVMYYAPEKKVSSDTTVEMTLLENSGNYSINDTIITDTAVYNVVSENLVPNGNFEYGMNGWYNRANTTPPESYSVTTNDKPAGVQRAAVSTGAGGATSTNSIKQAWKIEPGATYYYSLWVKAGDQWHGLGQSDSPATESQDIVANGGFGTSNTWVQNSGIFTATKNYLVFFEGWSTIGVSDVELYKIEEDDTQSAVTTIKFVDSGNEDVELANRVTVEGVIGSHIDLGDALLIPSLITYNNTLYAKDSSNPLSYTVKGNADVVKVTYSADKVETIESASATVIEGHLPVLPKTLKATTGAGMETTVKILSWDTTNLKVGQNTVYGVAEGTDVRATATVTVLEETFTLEDAVSRSDGAGTVVNFPLDLTGKFYIQFNFESSNIKNNWIYISKDGALWKAGQIGIGTNDDTTGSLKAQPVDSVIATLKAGTVYNMFVTGDASTDTYDLIVTNTETDEVLASVTNRDFRTASNAVNSINLCTNGGGEYTLSDIKVHAAQADIETYTVNAVSGSTALGQFKGLTTTAKKNGYNKQVIYPDTNVPHYDGYVFKNKTVSGTTVTLNYEEAKEGNFFDNVANDTPFVSLNMLGAHDAFTSGISTSGSKFDAAGILQGDSGSKAAYPTFGGNASSTTVNKSRAQSKDALTLLDSGVRYFDIRLSRSDKTAKAGLLNLATVQHTNSVFYTTHGLLSDEFKPIAYTIAQWAKEHPGEIIVLDFQEMWDATSSANSNGDSVAQSWRDLNALLEETGITDYVTINNNTDLSTVTYGSLTNNGEKAAIVLFGRATATNENIGKFILRGTTSTAFDGKMYSNYDKGGASVSSSGLAAAYIQSQVDHAYSQTGTVNEMYRVMQAISNTSNLINRASDDNTFIANAVTTNPTWLTTLPVIMVNDATVNTSKLLETLKSCNELMDVTLDYAIDGQVADSGKVGLMVGTLFTGGVKGAIYQGANGEYTVTEDLTGEVPVPYKGLITLSVVKNLKGYNVTIDGVTTVEYEKFTLPQTGVAYYNVKTQALYNPGEEILLTEDIELTGYVSLGVNMVMGAQVRIGDGVDEDGKISEGSGLRFITTVDYNDTLASLDMSIELEMGVEISAEDSESEPVKIKAEAWQIQDAVFTTAITNIAESNYNRRFTATPYIIVGGKTFYGEAVTRSIYQVSAGLLKNGYIGNDYSGEGQEEVSKRLLTVLNAYVNQTGVRLTLSDASESATLTPRTGDRLGAYTGEAFFTVGETTYSEGKYTVTLTAVGKSVIDVNKFNEYVRINNNNSQVREVTTITDNQDGTYTVVFDYGSLQN